MDIPYCEQVRVKSACVESVIHSIFPSAVIEAPVTGPDLGYRSRAQFRLSKEGLCFCEEHSNNNVLLKSCPVLDEKLNHFISDPPKLNLWEFEDGKLSCISTDNGVVWGDGMGWITVKNRRLPVSGEVFFQSNLILLHEMIEYIVSNVTGSEVMDLYAGVGTFSAFLEDRFTVTAVEINKKCLSLARQHLEHTRFFTSPVERWNPKKQHVDTVIVDPPRTGLDRAVPAMIASWQPKRIICVSCYLPTLDRDLHRFRDLGYTATHARLFDFYPHTPHVETVVMMSRVGN